LMDVFPANQLTTWELCWAVLLQIWHAVSGEPCAVAASPFWVVELRLQLEQLMQ
jgi:hypothetical protein